MVFHRLPSSLPPAATGRLFCLRVSPLTIMIIDELSCSFNSQCARILVSFLVEFVHLVSCSSCFIIKLLKQEVGLLPLKYKVDILSALKSAGYTSYRIRQEGILSQSTLQKLRQGIGVSWENIETICRLLQCQPGDIIEYVADNEAGE